MATKSAFKHALEMAAEKKKQQLEAKAAYNRKYRERQKALLSNGHAVPTTKASEPIPISLPLVPEPEPERDWTLPTPPVFLAAPAKQQEKPEGVRKYRHRLTTLQLVELHRLLAENTQPAQDPQYLEYINGYSDLKLAELFGAGVHVIVAYRLKRFGKMQGRGASGDKVRQDLKIEELRKELERQRTQPTQGLAIPAEEFAALQNTVTFYANQLQNLNSRMTDIENYITRSSAAP